MAKWLIKNEPDDFSYYDLERVRREPWDGVRNYMARNFLRAMKKGDLALFYHSNTTPPGVAGICRITKEAYPDPKQFDAESKYFDPASNPDDPRWSTVEVAPKRRLNYISLDAIKLLPEMAHSRLIQRGNRLSVMELTEEEFTAIVTAADAMKA